MKHILLLLVVMSVAWTEAPASESVVKGFIRHVSPPASLRTGRGETVRLTEADVGRVLYSDDVIRTSGNGSVLIWVHEHDGWKENKIHASSDWKPVVENQTPEDQADTEASRFLAQISTLGGAERGASSTLCPADGSSVRAGHLVLRWFPEDAAKVLTLSSSDGKVVWTQTVPSGAAGELLSVSAQAAMASIRDNGGGKVALRIQVADDKELRSTFYVLSNEEEKKVQTRLAAWDRAPDPMMRALGLATVFSSQKLYDEAADQYQRALSRARRVWS